jgi:hypothetical protein
MDSAFHGMHCHEASGIKVVATIHVRAGPTRHLMILLVNWQMGIRPTRGKLYIRHLC